MRSNVTANKPSANDSSTPEDIVFLFLRVSLCVPEETLFGGRINLPTISPLESDSRGVFHGDVLVTNDSSGFVEPDSSPRAANCELLLPLMNR